MLNNDLLTFLIRVEQSSVVKEFNLQYTSLCMQVVPMKQLRENYEEMFPGYWYK